MYAEKSDNPLFDFNLSVAKKKSQTRTKLLPYVLRLLLFLQLVLCNGSYLYHLLSRFYHGKRLKIDE